MYNEYIPKPYKSYRTQWIGHTLQAMHIALYLFSNSVLRIIKNRFLNTKRVEIEGEVKRWYNSTYIVH